MHRNSVVALVSVALLAGVFAGVFATTASAATFAVSMKMTAGTFATRGGTPNAVPVITTAVFTGTETTTTGSVTTATFKFPTQHESNTGSTETILVYTAPSTTVAGSVNTKGELSIGATLFYEVHITKPVTAACTTAMAVHVVLASTAPYTATTKTVAVKNSAIIIPDFKATGCIAASELNTTFSGSGGELGLALHGTLVVPPPGAATTTTLTATPASPQVQGSSVTLKATVKATGTLATSAKGTVTFYDGASVLGTAPVSAGTASYTSKTLLAGTDSLKAVFGGGGGYAGSMSPTITYVIKPAPSVSVKTLPTAITNSGTATTFHSFTVVLTNPPAGLSWTQMFLKVQLSGVRNLTATTTFVTLQYQDAGGGWCAPLGFSGTTTVTGYFVGARSSCTPSSYPASLSLAAGFSTTVHFRIAYPVSGFYGDQKITATLSTGSCTSATRCTAVTPLSGSAAPVGSGTVEVVPATPIPSQVKDVATRPATSAVRQTFNVGLHSKVEPATTVTEVTGLPAPTGTVSYTVDGHSITSAMDPAGPGRLTDPFSDANQTVTYLFNTAGLSTGTHRLIATYSGDSVYSSSTLTETFTVVAAPTGTPFVCSISGTPVPAYVTAKGTVPKATLATSTKTVPATNVSVTLIVDPVIDYSTYNTTQSAATLGFSPTGTSATAGPITFSGTTGTATEAVGTWSSASTSIPLRKGTAPGTTLAIGAASISFSTYGFAADCTPATAGVNAPIASTEVAGTTLAVTPTSAVAGTPVTLTASVYPTPTTTSSASTVTFSASGHTLGTVTVVDTGPTAGKAKLVETSLTAGHYTVVARWSGNDNPTVSANTSNRVILTVIGSHAGAPRHGVYTCTAPVVGAIPGIGVTFQDTGTQPSSLESGQTYTLQPKVTFGLTPSLIGLATGAGQWTFTVTAVTVHLKLTGFNSTTASKKISSTASALVQIGNKTIQVTTTGTTVTEIAHTSTATKALHTGVTWVTTGATIELTYPALHLTMGSRTTATVTPVGKVTLTVLTLAVPCHATTAPGSILSVALEHAALTLTPVATSVLPAGQANSLYTHGATYWTASGGNGTNTWTETGALDGLVFHGTGDHASLTGIPSAPGTFTFKVTVTTKTDPIVSHTYALHIATAPSTPITIQPYSLTVTPGTLTLTCTSADGPTLPNAATDVTSQATSKPCTEITLGSVTLNEKRQDVTTHGHNLIISTARGGPTDSWALYAVMVPTSKTLTGNPACTAVQGFCNVGTTNGTTLAHHFKNTTITPNYLGVSGQKCVPNSNPLTTYFNDNPTPTDTGGAPAGTPGLAAQTKLCSAATGNAGGQFFVTTLDYTLIAPPNVYVGTYYGTVLYTLSATAADIPPNPVTPPQ